MSILNIFQKKQKKEPKESSVKPKEQKEQQKEKPTTASADQITSVPPVFSKSSIKRQSLLIKPYLSEKFTLLGEKNNEYIFEVHSRATKNEIKKLLEGIYNVEVLKINVLSATQKTKKWRNNKNSLKGNKKMIVTLKEGQKIELGI
ncbi:MAG: 50S ribosomal protein L23 [Candidatus Pacebacteria bacterium]|nr:50S ribosomal protein L23 [Candidatus Paceibacterota bacterium]